MNRVDVSIIGGGPTGLFASFYAGLRGLSVRIIDSLPELGGQLTALYPEKFVYDMPGFPQVLAKDLAAGLIRQGTQFHPELVLEETAESLEQDDEGYTIIGAKGERYPTRTIIISAGAGAFSPTKIGLADEDAWVGRGLAYGVRSLEAFRDKRVLILGGGDSAFDWAVHLHPIAASVALVHRRDVFRAHEETVKEAEALGIPFHLFQVVKEIRGAEAVESVVLEDTRTKESTELPCDALVVNIGFKSSLGPLKDWGLEIEKNQIKVNELYETCLPGVFAVGDVCTFEGKIKLIATGVGEAATAVCVAKTRLDPTARLFPGHSSDMDLQK
ncbi:MAG: NAD(P)/FAD-dependent oxidoreductase [Fimbriimonadaceae bacterium]|nr:NAD(P)/FAD-dependent oxidoreductase [Fimbriimonadaceae bacterium]